LAAKVGMQGSTNPSVWMRRIAMVVGLAPTAATARLPRNGPTARKLVFAFCELRTMFRPASDYPDDITVYLAVNDFGSLGRAFVETDIAEADRETMIRNFLSRQYSNALPVVAVLGRTAGGSAAIHSLMNGHIILNII
jgi:hypothetical protein